MKIVVKSMPNVGLRAGVGQTNLRYVSPREDRRRISIAISIISPSVRSLSDHSDAE
jgi:hypothetical protein